jgi:ribosomal protein S18 acetylase RimI-like enzyme
MKINYTPWENRNLGVSTSLEYRIHEKDTWDEIKDEVKQHHEMYQVMHIPGGNTDVLYMAQTEGFKVIEMNLQLIRQLDHLSMPKVYSRFKPFISCHEADEQEKELILSCIKDGGIFSTDKISRDPRFGIEQSGWRYFCWTKDVIENGAKLLCMQYKGKTIGFDVFVQQDEHTAEAFLGGLIPEYIDSGLGFIMIYLITQYAKEKGFKRIVTGVSSNNIQILKLHELFGYSVSRCTYCLVKHM